MPEISIIVPIYNAAKYLNYCIESILAQTFTDFELILVDDGSTDGSVHICEGYQQRDCRIRIIHQPNQGQAVARNNALAKAKGEYIGFVDADDYIHPQMFEKLIINAKKNRAQVSIGGCKNVYNHEYLQNLQEENLQTYLWNGKEFVRHCLIEGVEKKTWVLWDKIFHKECFKNIRLPEGRIYEDNAVVYKILYEADIVVDCDTVFYYYFQNPDSTTNQHFNYKHLDWLQVPREMIDYFSKKQDELLLDRVNRMYLFAIEDLYRKVHRELNDMVIENQLKRELRKQYHKEKQRYLISIKTHPGLYEILFPKYSFIYWSLKGILNKVMGR